jgi:anti-sigma factor RsiW
MKCLDEGTLQAYLDSELPEARMRRAAGHLEACAPCRDRLGRIEAAVGRLNAWLDALAQAGLPALDEAVPRIAAKTGGLLRWRWAAVALGGALAASVALFFANSRPHPEPARAAKREAGMHKPQAPSVVYRAGPRGHPVRKRFPVHRQAPQPALDDFVPFDDADPMQMGMVVRVMLPVSDASLTGGAQEVAADLVIGEDGRARAIRLVR